MTFRFQTRTVPIKGVPHDFYVFEHPGAVAVVAWQAQKLLLIRQMQPATGGLLWEIPAGTLEAGEEPLACAARELAEETGYRASRIESLGQFYVAPGYSSERIYLFRATELTLGATHWDEGEAIEAQRWVDLDELAALIGDGTVVDAKSIAAYTYLTLPGRTPR